MKKKNGRDHISPVAGIATVLLAGIAAVFFAWSQFDQLQKIQQPNVWKPQPRIVKQKSDSYTQTYDLRQSTLIPVMNGYSSVIGQLLATNDQDGIGIYNLNTQTGQPEKDVTFQSMDEPLTATNEDLPFMNTADNTFLLKSKNLSTDISMYYGSPNGALEPRLFLEAGTQGFGGRGMFGFWDATMKQPTTFTLESACPENIPEFEYATGTVAFYHLGSKRIALNPVRPITCVLSSELGEVTALDRIEDAHYAPSKNEIYVKMPWDEYAIVDIHDIKNPSVRFEKTITP